MRVAGPVLRRRALLVPLLLLLLRPFPAAARPGDPRDGAADRRRGLELLAAGDLPRAIEALSHAVALAPGDATALSALTVAYLRNSDLEFAEFYFEQALRSDRRSEVPAGLWEAMGDAWSDGNRTREALEAWTLAWMGGDHTDALRARIERARRERALESGQQFFRGERFEIYFDPAIAFDDVQRAESLLVQAEKSESEFFDAPLSRPPVVVLYAGRSFVRVLDTPDWMAAYFDGRIHAPIFPLQSLDEEAAELLRHELAHAFLAQLSGGRAPAWLQEGLAQFVEGRRITPRELAAASLRVSEQPGVPRNADFTQRTDRDRARRAYLASLSFVQDLAARHGAGAVVCLVKDLGAGEELEVALRRELGAAQAELEAAWRERLAAGQAIPDPAKRLR